MDFLPADADLSLEFTFFGSFGGRDFDLTVGSSLLHQLQVPWLPTLVLTWHHDAHALHCSDVVFGIVAVVTRGLPLAFSNDRGTLLPWCGLITITAR